MAVEEAGFTPFLTFDDVTLPQDIMKVCSSFEKPTPIQAQTWPILTKGRDVVGIAETGSGKTLAFSLPGMERIKRLAKANKGQEPPIPSPRMLVLAPTRELAQQSADVIREAGLTAGLRSVVVYGGMPKHVQRQQLQKGCDCVVATPGRLKDFMQENSISLARVTYLVLDEADRMLDMGFAPEVRYIVKECASPGPDGRQTAMFSATWPMEIRKLASEFLTNPVRVTLGSDVLTANHRVSQHVEVFDDEYRREARLKQLLKEIHKGQKNRVIVFALYKKEAARLEENLRRAGWNVGAVHGDRNQRDRESAVANFKSNKVPLLVATDVAARGLGKFIHLMDSCV